MAYLAALFFVLAIVSLFHPKLLLSEYAEWDFNGDERKRRHYLIHTRLNLLCAGALTIAADYIPEPLSWSLLALWTVSLLVCNKVNRGTFFPWERFI